MKFLNPKNPTFMEIVGAMFFVTVFLLLIVDGIVRTVALK